MSTKYFDWGGDALSTVAGKNYTDGNPIEAVIFDAPRLAIQGWHNVAQGHRVAITAALVAAGWIEGGQSKPD